MSGIIGQFSMGILSRKGLTLIELMIVIVILAIMASALYPDYKSYMQYRRLKGAALAVTLDLMLARMQAISMNRDVSVVFPISPSSQHDRYTYDAAGNAVIKNIKTDLGYYDVTLSADNNPLFSSRGIARNAAGTNPVTTVTLSNPAGSKTVTVNIVGYVTMN
jgi:prepilin-type N-terminal cleavage/methylation domain-containing protein